MILLNQAGKNTHEDICSSLELFAKEVMPEFHASEAQTPGMEGAGAGRRIELEDIDTEPYNFAARGKPTQVSTKESRNMVAGVVGRPSAESLG